MSNTSNKSSNKGILNNFTKSLLSIFAILAMFGSVYGGYVYFKDNLSTDNNNTDTAKAASPNSIGVNKTGFDAFTNSTTQVKAGSTAQWVLSYSNNSGAIQDNVVINDAIPAKSKFVGGSLVTPPSFTKKYSTNNGGTFANTEPNPANTTTNIQAIGTNIPSPATGTVQTFGTPVLQAIGTSATTGGDGYLPFFFDYTDTSGNPATRIFTIFHHTGPDPTNTTTPTTHPAQINCIQFLGGNVASGSICPTYPRYFSSTLGSSGIPDPNPNATPPNGVADIYTEQNQSSGFIYNSKIYYVAQRSADVGVGCWDPIQDKNCGYSNVASLGVNMTTMRTWTAINSSTMQGSKIFMPAADAKMYCFDLATMANCANYPKQMADLVSNYLNDGTNMNLIFFRGNRFQNKLFLVGMKINSTPGVSSWNSIATLSCFDLQIEDNCTGWNNVVNISMNDPVIGVLTTPILTLKKTNPTDTVANSLDKVCTRTETANISNVPAPIPGLTCFNVSDKSAASMPASLTNILPPGLLLQGNNNIANRFSYFSIWNDYGTPADTVNGSGYMSCYDWVLSSPCSTFGTNGSKYFNINNNNLLKIYGTTYYKGCLYALGDAGILWSVDPITGATPCQTASSSTDIRPLTNFYCDGKNRAITYDKIQFFDLAGVGAGSGINGITSEIKDANGIFIKSVNIQNGTGNISDIPYGSNVTFGDIKNLDTTTLKIESYAYGNTTILAAMNGKQVGVFFNAPDAPQICFKTSVDLLTSPNTPLTNTVSGSSIFAQPSLTYTLNIVPGVVPVCTKAPANSVTTCVFPLPTGLTSLPTDFKLSIGTGSVNQLNCNNTTTPNTPGCNSANTAVAQACTLTSGTVTCNNIPTGNSIGNIPIYGQFTGTAGSKTPTGETVNIVGLNFGGVTWTFTPNQGGTAPLFRNTDDTTININNFKTILDPTPTSNTRYTCNLEYRKINDRLATTTPTWTTISTTPTPYTTGNTTNSGCSFTLTKAMRLNNLNYSLRLTITDTTITNPNTTTNPNTYTFYNEYIYRFQGAGVASGG